MIPRCCDCEYASKGPEHPDCAGCEDKGTSDNPLPNFTPKPT